jgi:tripeptidyl-peptidase-1
VVKEQGIKDWSHRSWVKGNRVSGSDTVDVTFVMHTCPKKRAELEEKFWAVSNPQSPEYKKYLSLTEVADLLHPLPTEEGKQLAADAVTRYLYSVEGLVHNRKTTMTKTRDLVKATLNAAAAEKFFGTHLYHFQPSGAAAAMHPGLDVIRAGGEYTLPDDIADKVSIVEKLIRLPSLEAPKIGAPSEVVQKLRGAGGDDPFNSCDTKLCTGATTPAVLQARYGYPKLSNYTKGNGMAVAEFQFQGVDDEDLSNFASTCAVDHVSVDTTEGAGGNLMPGVEALLDVEYIEAVAAPIPLTVINSVSFSLFDWAENLNNDDSPALVQSVSYGNDEVQQTSAEYMYDCNTQFMMNGVRGLSVLFASGDQGVWGRTGHSPTSPGFHPDFPAGSPYVTAVGGTQFLTTSTIGEETTWADGGGGFSDTFAVPDYQKDAVASYFSSGVALPPAEDYNATGRGYPDVSALAGQANGYCVAARGNYLKVGGTSAACPVFAAHIAILNDKLLASGQAPMGFLNQWIHGVAGPAGAFNDVTTGTNNAGYGDGFTAAKGWDPATGWGTPNYAAMEKLLNL